MVILPTSRELYLARDHFRTLLSVPTKESQWQNFFSEYPYVLSMSFPLSLQPSDIITLGRPGKTEPDFIFYPQEKNPIPFYGIVELKRPDSKIITITRSNVALLTRDAETAIEQARSYSHMSGNMAPLNHADKLLFLGNRIHLFIIMGMSQELSTKLSIDIYKEMVERKLPDNLQLIPYDVLLGLFETNLPPRVYFLLPEVVEEAIEIIGRVDRATINIIEDDLPEKGSYAAVEFFESNYGHCIVVTKLATDTADFPGIDKLNSTYPKVKVTVKPHKGNLIPAPSTWTNKLFEALSDYDFL